MLKIIEGSTYSEAPELIREAIKKSVSGGTRTMLIVPEQQTVIAEKEMASLLSDDSPILFEVTNFTRFANSVFRTLGGVDKEYCDSVKSALLMWRTLSELAPTLSVTDGKREINYGMVKKALVTSGESDGLAITAEDLVSAKEKIGEDKRLSKKLDDLIKITSLYKKLLSEKYSDVGEDIAAATKMLRENPNRFTDTVFFIEGFTSFTEPQHRLLELLISSSEVTALLDIPKSRRDAFEYSELLLTEKRLISSANKVGTELKLIKLDGLKNGNQDIYDISNYLWRKTQSVDNISLQNPSDVRIFEALTPYDECDFIVSDIKRRVMLGASYSDFAVIGSDISSYGGILDVCARQAGVPLFISKSRDVSSFEAIKLIYTALSAVTQGFSREDVISYAKCGLSSITREECDEFELYVERWKISGRLFTDSTVWNMNPDEYSTFRTEDTDSRLVRLDSIRRTLISPLTELKVGLDDAVTVSDFAIALYKFIKSISLYEKIKKRADELYALGECELAEENERIYKTICDSLDTLVEVSGDMKSDADGFISQLKIAFSAASVMKIPSVSDSVTAASAKMARLTEKKHIYLLGINRGEFPASVNSDSYFSEKDKAELRDVGLPFEPDMLIKESKELYYFSKAFLYAKETVTLLYSAKSTDYSPIRRADVIDRITALTGESVKVFRISEIKQSELAYSPEQALLSLGKFDNEEYIGAKKSLSDAGFASRVSLAEMRVENDKMALSEKVTERIYPSDILLSQSKIDSYNTCPLAYFCRYDLGLSENEAAAFDARNIGSLVHAILENFFAILAEEGRTVGEITEEEKEELINKSAALYLDKILPDDKGEDIRASLLTKRLIRATTPIIDGLMAEFSGSRYQPRYFELRIGGKSENSPELLAIDEGDGNKTLIKGSIDRVDTYKFGDDVYVRVVDYKTGHKDFSPEDLAKGKNLQMFLYLAAVIDTKNRSLRRDIGLGENGRLIPAGVIYVKSDLSDVKISHASAAEEENAVKADQKRQGMLLDDAVSISAMNTAYLPIKIKNDGSYYKDSESLLYNEEGWKSLCDTVEDSVKRVTKKMRSGNISAEPMIEKRSSPCQYCNFKPVCRNAKF